MVQGAKDDPDGAHPVARPYTPVSSPDMQGAFELLIKSYPQGRVSRYLHSRREGDRVWIKGPFPKLAYR
jgi:cytochrome-b5 reductase